MKPKYLSYFLIACLPVVSLANPGTLNTISYNFQISGGGGGSSATFNNQPIEIFCVDFANDIYVPQLNYSANLTTLTGSPLSNTRFGGTTNWVVLNSANYSGGGSAFTAADATFINGASALQRYQMAAYLVSTYQFGSGYSNTNPNFNAGVQEAIWEILDSSSYGSIGAVVNPLGVSLTSSYVANALHGTATWLTGYINSNDFAGLNGFLANYRIVSDATMTNCGASGTPLCGGFQEQITVVPEPLFAGLALIGLLPILWFLRRSRAAGCSDQESVS